MYFIPTKDSLYLSMFGKLGKQYAAQVGDAIEGLVNTKLNAVNSSTENHGTEKPQEVLTNINGKRKALFIGINYFGTKSELKG